VTELLLDAETPENDWSDQLRRSPSLSPDCSVDVLPDEDERAMSAAELEEIRLTL
jgi:hypothetical protein